MASSVRDPRDIPRAVHEAMRELRTGRPRPVAIDIPPETLAKVDEIVLFDPAPVRREAGDPDLIDRAAQLLAAAKLPVIWAGGGINLGEASRELTAVADYLQAPVITTAEGKGAISDRHPLSLGGVLTTSGPLHGVLAVGSRLTLTTATLKAPQTVVQIEADPEELGRNYANTFGIAGDAKATLPLLLERLQAHTPQKP